MERVCVHSLAHSLKLVTVYGVRQLSHGLIILFSFNGSIIKMRES